MNRRIYWSPKQVEFLTALYESNTRPNRVELSSIACLVNSIDATNFNGRHVQLWFQNRRQRQKQQLVGTAHNHLNPVSASIVCLSKW